MVSLILDYCMNPALYEYQLLPLKLVSYGLMYSDPINSQMTVYDLVIFPSLYKNSSNISVEVIV